MSPLTNDTYDRNWAYCIGATAPVWTRLKPTFMVEKCGASLYRTFGAHVDRSSRPTPDQGITAVGVFLLLSVAGADISFSLKSDNPPTPRNLVWYSFSLIK